METVRMNMPGKLKYGQWKRVTVDDKGRTRMVTNIVEIELSKETFVSTFEKPIENCVAHVERVRKQYNEIRTLKENLGANYVLLQMDFAKKYTCRIVDEVQSAYWSQSAVMLHPVVYYNSGKDDNQINHKSLVLVSDEMGHNTKTVQCFMEIIVPEIKSNVPGAQTFLYWTDIPTSQYRNKSIFQTVANHEALYGVKAVRQVIERGLAMASVELLNG